MCGMQSGGDAPGGGKATLMFKYSADSEMFVHAFKSGWRIWQAPLPVEMVFDKARTAAEAIGSMSAEADVEWTVPIEYVGTISRRISARPIP